jgi:hypothetical protein
VTALRRPGALNAACPDAGNRKGTYEWLALVLADLPVLNKGDEDSFAASVIIFSSSPGSSVNGVPGFCVGRLIYRSAPMARDSRRRVRNGRVYLRKSSASIRMNMTPRKANAVDPRIWIKYEPQATAVRRGWLEVGVVTAIDDHGHAVANLQATTNIGRPVRLGPPVNDERQQVLGALAVRRRVLDRGRYHHTVARQPS